MNINHILVIADPADQEQKALARAELMAQRHQASVLVVAFCFEDFEELSDSLSEQQREAAIVEMIRQRNAWLQQQVGESSLPATTEFKAVWEQDISGWVSSYCEQTPTDVVIKTGHRTEGLFYTPTDWRLMRDCPCPVMIVAEKHWRKQQSVVVCLDLATRRSSKKALNQSLLDAAIYMAETMELPLHVCYSLDISPVLKDLDLVDKHVELDKARAKYPAIVKEMAGAYPIDDKHIHIKSGEAPLVIPSVAAEVGAALVVMGSVGRKGIHAKIMGNTAEDVLALLKANVLVIQPHHE